MTDHTGSDAYGLQDPGWLPTGRQAPISPTRLIVLSFAIVVLLLGFVLSFAVAPGSDDGGDPVAWLLVGVGALAALVGIVLGRRPLAEPTLGAVIIRLFRGLALTESAALLGFVGAFIGGGLTTYFVAAPITLLGLALIAPTDGRLRADDLDLQRRGIHESVRAQAYGATTS